MTQKKSLRIIAYILIIPTGIIIIIIVLIVNLVQVNALDMLGQIELVQRCIWA